MMTCLVPMVAAFVVVVAIRTYQYTKAQRRPAERVTVVEEARQLESPE